jgi:ABC-type sulfate transport system permease component
VTQTSKISGFIKAPSLRKALLLAALWLAPIFFLILFYFYPLGRIFQLSFARAELGLAQPLMEAITSESIRQVIWFTFWQATVSTLLTLAIGLPGAYLFARFDFRGKSILQAVSGIPFVMPTLVVAAAFNALLGPRGWVNLVMMELFDLQFPPIRFTNTLLAILVAHIFYNLTIILRFVGDFWSHLDPRLSQAARTLGANRQQTFSYLHSAALYVRQRHLWYYIRLLHLGDPHLGGPFARREKSIIRRSACLMHGNHNYISTGVAHGFDNHLRALIGTHLRP